MTIDTMTQRHQTYYALIHPDGKTTKRTTDRNLAAFWHTMCREKRARTAPGTATFRVHTGMEIWFSCQRADAAAQDRWEAEMDRRYGL